jgi:integrase
MAKRKKSTSHMILRGKVWYFVKMHEGKRHHLPLSSDQKTAERLRDDYLYELRNFGEIVSLVPQAKNDVQGENVLLGEVAEKWSKVKEKQVEESTMRDYRSAMNTYVLPRFGNTAINQIGFLDIEEFRSELPCSAKRKNNILVPVRDVFLFALKAEFIDKNPLDLVKNLKEDKPDIFPLSMEEVERFLENVVPYYKIFFAVAFFTGMRFGEMAALKWRNVDFNLGFIKVWETRVRGIEKKPKTPGSYRDIKMLPPVIEALLELKQNCKRKSDYVFLNKKGRPLLPNSINYHIWKPGLKKAGLEPRSLYTTRHTFATLMLDSGEHPGWVQKMMGHASLKMIYERYYKYIKDYQKDEGEAFMNNAYNSCFNTEKPEQRAN